MNRTSQEVFENHLQLRLEGKTDEDIKTNYAPNVVLISSIKTYYGHKGIEESANELAKDFGDSKFEYVRKVVEGDFAFLIWKAESQHKKVEHGVDSFIIRDSKIVAQSVFYAVENK